MICRQPAIGLALPRELQLITELSKCNRIVMVPGKCLTHTFSPDTPSRAVEITDSS
jgi:hypothetical protein